MLAGLALFGVIGSRSKDATRQGTRARLGSLVAVATLTLMGLSALRLLPVAAIALAGFAAGGVARISELEQPSLAVRRLVATLGLLAMAGAGVSAWSAPPVDLSRYPVEETD